MQLSSKNILALAFLIIALSLGYYFVIYLPRSAEEKLKQAEDAKTQERMNEYYRQANIDKCLKDASSKLHDSWNDVCKAKGLEENCLQPLDVVEIQDNRAKLAKEGCLKRYSQK